MKDLYTKNQNPQMKEIKENTNEQKVFGAWGLEELTLLNQPNQLKQFTVSINSYQNSKVKFYRNNNPKICMESQKIPIVKEILQKNNKAEGIHTF